MNRKRAQLKQLKMCSKRVEHHIWCLTLSALFLVNFVSCTKTTPTQLVLSISTDLATPLQLDEIEVNVEQQGQSFHSQSYNLDPLRPQPATLPATLTLVAKNSIANAVTITVTGNKATSRIVEHVIRTKFIFGKALLIRIELKTTCLDTLVSCGTEQTCKDGSCIGIDVDAKSLSIYSESEAFRSPKDASVDAISTGNEDCLDGVDNDEDQLIDCADPDCQNAGYQCTPLAPSEWMGYVKLNENFQSVSGPPCANAFSNLQLEYRRAWEGINTAGCTTCSCSGQGNGSCKPSTMECWNNATCSGQSDRTVSVTNSCSQMGVGSLQSCRMTGSEVDSHWTCAPKGGLVNPTGSFQKIIHACGHSQFGGGCASGDVCIPPIPSGYPSGVCIQRDGNHVCPSATLYRVKVLSYGGAKADQRSCTPCTCTETGACASATYRLHRDTLCTDGIGLVSESNCVDISTVPFPTNNASVALVNSEVYGGSCSVTGGGVPSGEVIPEQTVTYCCAP